MKIGPVIHGGLLLTALLVGYQTSTRKEKVETKYGSEAAWHVEELAGLRFESKNKKIVLEWRGEGQSRYLWGRTESTKVANNSSKKVADTSSEKVAGASSEKAASTSSEKAASASSEKAASASSEKVAGASSEKVAGASSEKVAGASSEKVAGTSPDLKEPQTTIREFPIGEKGDSLMVEYQDLPVLRSLGVLSADQLDQYDLLNDTDSLIFVLKDGGERRLTVASKTIVGNKHRYILDSKNNTGYVISEELIRPVRNADRSLSLKKVHSYDKTSLASVEIKTSAGSQIVLKTEEASGRGVWHRQESPEQTDAALTSLITRVNQLRPSVYNSALHSAELVNIAEFDYKNNEGQSIGYLKLYRQLPVISPSDEEPKKDKRKARASRATRYYIETERTRVLAEVRRVIADRVDQDLVEIFGIAPPPKPPPRPSAVSPAAGSLPAAPGEGGRGKAPKASATTPGASPSSPEAPSPVPAPRVDKGAKRSKTPGASPSSPEAPSPVPVP